MPDILDVVGVMIAEAVAEAKIEERARIKKILDTKMDGHSLIHEFFKLYREVFDA